MKHGDFLIHKRRGYLAVVVANKIWPITNISGNVYQKKYVAWNISVARNFDIATPAQIATILHGRPMPEWVTEMVSSIETPKQPSYDGTWISPKMETPQVATVPQTGPLSLLRLQNDCNHSWREYVGFREVYMYCAHCDKKKRV